jgi:Alginate export
VKLALSLRMRPRSIKPLAAAVITACGIHPGVAGAQDTAQTRVVPAVPERPTILPNRRWDEDWSVLADPRIKREPLDDLKYLPFSRHHPRTYLSFGFNLRERIEVDHSPFFGVLPGLKGEWFLSRLEVHADLRLGDLVQVFAQLQSAFAPGKKVLAPVDEDRLDVEQVFIGLTLPVRSARLTLRLGRQLLPVELQRFVSVRDGPNLRQAYDAAYADYQRGAWRVTGAYARPVQIRDLRAFDDSSDGRLTVGGLLIRRRLLGSAQLAVDFIHYTRDAAVFTTVSGDERREIIDLRFRGAANGFDWDVEAMNQAGRIGSQDIDAKAFGSSVGYTFADVGWTPRLSLGVDLATGDRNPQDNRLETFNPLFPNGYYLAGYTGYPNLIHLKPAVMVRPTRPISLMFALAGQWRETTADAVYQFPGFPVGGTAGRPGRYTGAYGEIRGAWTITPHYSVAFDAVRYAIGDAIREAGGHDANYLGVELRYGW